MAIGGGIFTSPAVSAGTTIPGATANSFLYADSAGAIRSTAAGNNLNAATGGAGVPAAATATLAQGGTSAALTANNGGIFYSTGTAGAILAGTATAGQILRSGASGPPSWSTATYPATTTVDRILVSTSNNVVGEVVTGNNGVLITSGTGVPSISSTIPSATQDNITRLGTIVAGVWNGTAVAVANGGTGQTSYTDGQILIGNTTGNTLAKATLTATANQTTVTNGAGTITIGTVQSIGTGSTPQFTRLGLGAAAHASIQLSATQTSVGSITYPLIVVNNGGGTTGDGVGIYLSAFDVSNPSAAIINTRIAAGNTYTTIFKSFNAAASLTEYARLNHSTFKVGLGSVSSVVATNTFDYSATWDDGGSYNGLFLNITNTSSNVASLLTNWQIGGATKFSVDVNGVVQDGGSSRVTTQFDKTADIALANITGLTATVRAGKSYGFRAVLHVTPDATGGHKYAIAGTATATAIVYQIDSIRNGTNVFGINSRQTALGGSAGEASGTANLTIIEGMITVNAAGTLVPQFAQNASNLTSSVLVGSTFTVWQIA